MDEIKEEILGFWERLFGIKNKYGYWQMIKLVLFVGFTIAFLYMAKNFGENFTFERQKEVMTEVIQETNLAKFEEHAEQMEMREQIKPYVSELLKNTISTMACDRAFVIELHNGSNNTAGLPFIHCTMTYEEDARDVESIDEDYQNLSLSRFNFPEYLHKNDFWYGSLDEFEEIDKKAATRMKLNGASYLVIATIGTGTNEIGYFGFTYCEGHQPKNEKEILGFVVDNVQKLVKWLDKDITEF